MIPWKKFGVPIKNSKGNPITCNECPCPDDCADNYPYGDVVAVIGEEIPSFLESDTPLFDNFYSFYTSDFVLNNIYKNIRIYVNGGIYNEDAPDWSLGWNYWCNKLPILMRFIGINNPAIENYNLICPIPRHTSGSQVRAIYSGFIINSVLHADTYSLNFYNIICNSSGVITIEDEAATSLGIFYNCNFSLLCNEGYTNGSFINIEAHDSIISSITINRSDVIPGSNDGATSKRLNIYLIDSQCGDIYIQGGASTSDAGIPGNGGSIVGTFKSSQVNNINLGAGGVRGDYEYSTAWSARSSLTLIDSYIESVVHGDGYTQYDGSWISTSRSDITPESVSYINNYVCPTSYPYIYQGDLISKVQSNTPTFLMDKGTLIINNFSSSATGRYAGYMGAYFYEGFLIINNCNFNCNGADGYRYGGYSTQKNGQNSGNTFFEFSDQYISSPILISGIFGGDGGNGMDSEPSITAPPGNGGNGFSVGYSAWGVHQSEEIEASICSQFYLGKGGKGGEGVFNVHPPGEDGDDGTCFGE